MSRRLWFLIDWLIIALPAWPLLNFHHHFLEDWQNHLWQIGYYGEYFRQNGSFPRVFTTPEVVGVTYPLFYGPLIYPLLGLLSAFLPANVVFRVFAVALLAVQYFLVKKLFKSVTQDAFLSRAVAAVVVWDIYVMTNIYDRGALTEFIAVGFLQCALCLILLWTLAPKKTPEVSPKNRPGAFLGIAAFLLVLMAGTHTITALYGSLFCLFLFFAAGPWIFQRIRSYDGQYQGRYWGPLGRRFFGLAGIMGVAGVLALAPWLYVVARFHDKLLVSGEVSRITLIPGVDTWLARLSVFPLDPRAWGVPFDKLRTISTPYLDAQINFPLLLFVFLFFWSARKSYKTAGPLARRLVSFGLSAFLVFLILSVTGWIWNWIPSPFHVIQFGYRLVSYCNFGLWIALLGFAIAFPKNRNKNPYPKKALALILVLSAACVLVKIPRAQLTLAAKQDSPAAWDGNDEDSRKNLIHISDFFYGFGAYSVQKPYPDAEFETPQLPRQKIPMAVGTGSQFGRVAPAPFELTQNSTALFYAQAFPWNVISLNGHVLKEELKHYRSFYAADLPPGHYTFEYRFEPDKLWSVLYDVSWVSLGFLFILTLSLAFRPSGHKGD